MLIILWADRVRVIEHHFRICRHQSKKIEHHKSVKAELPGEARNSAQGRVELALVRYRRIEPNPSRVSSRSREQIVLVVVESVSVLSTRAEDASVQRITLSSATRSSLKRNFWSFFVYVLGSISAAFGKLSYDLASLLLDRVANSHLHHLAPGRSNNFYRSSGMRSAIFPRDRISRTTVAGRCRTGRQLNSGHPTPLINPAFPRAEEDMWKVGSIWKTECFQHQQRSDWLASMLWEVQFFAPRHVQKSTHSIPFETGQDHPRWQPIKALWLAVCFLAYYRVNRIEFCGRVGE
jgi:hypothetical protein